MASRKKKHVPTPVVHQRAPRYWFAAKRYGWGWTPATWEGWVVLGTYIVVVLVNFFRIRAQTTTVSETMSSFIPETAIITFFLFYVCLKTGENPSHRSR